MVFMKMTPLFHHQVVPYIIYMAISGCSDFGVALGVVLELGETSFLAVKDASPATECPSREEKMLTERTSLLLFSTIV